MQRIIMHGNTGWLTSTLLTSIAIQCENQDMTDCCYNDRQWVIRTYSLWDKELEYVEKLISEDIRNNSAWNQRYFVVSNTTKFSEDVIKREIE